jgi:hypothetical protein
MRRMLFGWLLLAGLAMELCVQEPLASKDDALIPSAQSVSHYLPNLLLAHDQVWSGGKPIGESAFTTLAAMGIQTIISVDGEKPDVAAAASQRDDLSASLSIVSRDCKACHQRFRDCGGLPVRGQ